MNSFKFNNIWLVVPFLSHQTQELLAFLEKHKWFLERGGFMLLKASGIIDSAITNKVQATGATLVQRVDSGLYDAWNQSMDYLRDIDISDDTYISFLGLDDEICEDYCIEVTKLIHNSKLFDFIYGNVQVILNGRFRVRMISNTPALFGKNNYSFDVFNPGMMNRWATINRHRFDTKYKLAADFDFYIGIAQERLISSRHLQIVQAKIGAAGVSNSTTAKEIYIREWKEISLGRNVKLDLDIKRMNIMNIISKSQFLFKLLRRLYWAIIAKKL